MPNTREKLFALFQDCNNPAWKWFPNNAEMLKLVDYLIANGVTEDGKKYEAIEKFIKRKVLDSGEPTTAEVYWKEFERELEKVYNGVTVQGWISVKDRLPEDREWVLVWHTGYSTPKKAKHKDDCDPHLPIFILDGDKGLDGEITHWMPIPQPPKLGNKQDHQLDESSPQKNHWRE